MDIDLAVLRSFVVLADELHFAKAAERLHIEQPALSQRIKRLERRMGVQLLVRDTRNVRLSPAGAEFAADTARMLRLFDEAVGRARETAVGERGTVNIAYTLSVGYETLPVLLEHLEQSLPHLTLQAVEAWEKDVLESVRLRRSDVGLVRCDSVDEELVSLLLRREGLVVAMPETHHLARQDVVHLAELRGERFVTTPSSLAPGYQATVDGVFEKAGFRPQTVRNTVPGSRLMAVQRQTGSVALLAQSARLSRPPGIAFVPVGDDFAVLPVRLVHRADAPAAICLLADVIQREAHRRWLSSASPR
ncbi:MULTISPECIES: LysR substrate-binding domain-containing protein [Streptomyces]|uniref:LysR substrate-binding domain-containing protein n=1 Tax=Streptomyces doudnae TaxID=3075536 RepID=A0ABD5F038_9ACTN|nr:MULTISPECIES: LysR substrate-binding domain-containing protein [unclassified Streptomyces]MDT0440275.1 LysR substrate-binding domain-containing protein [Streptomyces sp. DSM 41981]MYQ62050.1 LysR family transcriptional regulator [Streptomyces sp. SID4950]SCD29440.1 transcriptional regulator, LysR family [Streptomyces sp. SolWspMP-5a-2]